MQLRMIRKRPGNSRCHLFEIRTMRARSQEHHANALRRIEMAEVTGGRQMRRLHVNARQIRQAAKDLQAGSDGQIEQGPQPRKIARHEMLQAGTIVLPQFRVLEHGPQIIVEKIGNPGSGFSCRLCQEPQILIVGIADDGRSACVLCRGFPAPGRAVRSGKFRWIALPIHRAGSRCNGNGSEMRSWAGRAHGHRPISKSPNSAFINTRDDKSTCT